MLHIPLPRFALSTLIGFTAKGYVYASAVNNASYFGLIMTDIG